jgi:hypothetical protein
MVVPWTACLFFYTVLHFTYRTDQRAALAASRRGGQTRRGGWSTVWQGADGAEAWMEPAPAAAQAKPEGRLGNSATRPFAPVVLCALHFLHFNGGST